MTVTASRKAIGAYDVVISGGVGLAVGDTIEVRVGQTRLLVETIPASGSELTSGRLIRASEHVLEAFERAQGAIVEVASSAVQVIERAEARAVRPDRMEIEFGVGFSAQGDVVVAAVEGHASLLVRLVYERSDQED
jgi:hypothetical protein